MKTCFCLFFLIFLFKYSIAQTDDLKSKLEQYKSLYEQKLIDSAEYSKLKQELLFNKSETEDNNTDAKVMKTDQMDSESLKALKKKYKSQKTFGTVLTVAGGIGLAAGLSYWMNGEPTLKDTSVQGLKNFKIDYNSYKGGRVVYTVGSGFFILTGVIFQFSSANNKRFYLLKKEKLSLVPQPNGISLVLKFN